MALIGMGLDIATSSAATWTGPDGRPISETYRAPSPDGSSQDGFDYSRTFAGFHRWLVGKIEIVRPTFIAFEAPLTLIGRGGAKVMTSQNTVRILFGLAAIAEMTAAEAHIQVTEVNVQAVKKFLAGTGRADKAAMIARCRQLNWPVTNDHEADACGIWAMAMSRHDPKWSPNSTPLFSRPT